MLFSSATNATSEIEVSESMGTFKSGSLVTEDPTRARRLKIYKKKRKGKERKKSKVRWLV